MQHPSRTDQALWPINSPASLRLVAVGVASLLAGSCQQIPVRSSGYATTQPHRDLPVLVARQPAPVPSPAPTLTVEETTTLHPAPVLRPHPLPESYQRWLSRVDSREISAYRHYLKSEGVRYIPSMDELLQTARKWQECNHEQYGVPPRELWSQMVPTLRVLDQLRERGILQEFSVTSTYRDPELNRCAGGSSGSKHVFNAALDVRLEGGQAPLEQQAAVREQLCEFWKKRGEALNLGLGLYASGQIHIDTQGYRTWGPDYTRATSVCGGSLDNPLTARASARADGRRG